MSLSHSFGTALLAKQSVLCDFDGRSDTIRLSVSAFTAF